MKYNERIVILTPCLVSVAVHMRPGRSEELQPVFQPQVRSTFVFRWADPRPRSMP